MFSECLRDFEAIKKRIAQQAVFREDVNHYQEYAIMKLLSTRSPFECEMNGCRSTQYSSENDMIILYGIALYGWGEWARIRELINTYKPFQFDYNVRLKGDSDLCKRAEVIMRAVKKERDEVNGMRRQLMNEKETLMKELKGLETSQSQVIQKLVNSKTQIEELQKQVDFSHEQQFSHATLGDLQLTEDTMIKLVPVCEMLRGGVYSSGSELERFIRQRVQLPVKTIHALIGLLTDREKSVRMKYYLKSQFINPLLNCVDFSSEMVMTERMKQACLECAIITNKDGGLRITDLRLLLEELEEKKNEKMEKLISFMKEKGVITASELYSETVLKQIDVTKNEMISMASKCLTVSDKVEDLYLK